MLALSSALIVSVFTNIFMSVEACNDARVIDAQKTALLNSPSRVEVGQVDTPLQVDAITAASDGENIQYYPIIVNQELVDDTLFCTRQAEGWAMSPFIFSSWRYYYWRAWEPLVSVTERSFCYADSTFGLFSNRNSFVWEVTFQSCLNKLKETRQLCLVE